MQNLSFVLANPYLYLLIAAFVVSQLLLSQLVRLATQSPLADNALAPGCLTTILAWLWQTLMVAVFLMAYLPMLAIGKSDGLLPCPGSYLYLMSVFNVSLYGVGFVFFLTWIPVLGKALASSPGMEALLSLALAFYFLLPRYARELMRCQEELELTLGVELHFWSMLICLSLALLLMRGAMLAIGLMAQAMESKGRPRASMLLLRWLGPGLDVLVGLMGFVALSAYFIKR